MILFLLDLVSISMVLMASVLLIILRQRTDSRILMASIFAEAAFASVSLLWSSSAINTEVLVLRFIGRTIEAVVMWGVIAGQIREIRTAGNPSVSNGAELSARFDRLEKLLERGGLISADKAH